MKLFTHNMLSSGFLKKAVKGGYPLKIQATEIQIFQKEFKADCVIKFMPKVDYSGLYLAAKDLGKADLLPEKLPDDFEKDLALVQKLHHLLFEVDVIEGDLICPETERKFPINQGIPNMLLNEDEV